MGGSSVLLKVLRPGLAGAAADSRATRMRPLYCSASASTSALRRASIRSRRSASMPAYSCVCLCGVCRQRQGQAMEAACVCGGGGRGASKRDTQQRLVEDWQVPAYSCVCVDTWGTARQVCGCASKRCKQERHIAAVGVSRWYAEVHTSACVHGRLRRKDCMDKQGQRTPPVDTGNVCRAAAPSCRAALPAHVWNTNGRHTCRFLRGRRCSRSTNGSPLTYTTGSSRMLNHSTSCSSSSNAHHSNHETCNLETCNHALCHSKFAHSMAKAW